MRGLLVAAFLLLTIGGTNAHNKSGNSLTWDSRTYSWTSTVQPVTKQRTGHPRVRTHHRLRRVPIGHPTVPILPKDSGDLVTVPTAAGIAITVERKLVPQFQGFIDDLIKLGYTPKHIGCWAPVGTHVANSNHYHGGACDFDQTGWNRTATEMYHVGTLATKWGLRDGCSFRRADCGHIDDGTNIGWKHPNNLIAKYIDLQMTPVTKERILDNFEGGL